MINDTEIRTGNLYTTIRNQEIIVRGIDTINKFVTVDHIELPGSEPPKGSNTIIFEDLNPIEIRSLKSDRLGFTPDKLMCLPVTSDKDAKFQWNEETNQIVFKDGQGGAVGQTIQYVHQFQNLYYFLTGRDLVI